MIIIVDFGMGNLESIARAFRRVEAEVAISSEPQDVLSATKLVLPGVGAFGKGIAHIDEMGLREPLDKRVTGDRIPTLGICLGFQLFTRHSEEGDADGLGWIEGQTRRFRFDESDEKLKVPHIGWNEIVPQKKDSPLFNKLDESSCFYFQHSYYVTCDDQDAVLATCHYGHEFVCAVHKDNLFGVQFHPEKSHANGLTLVRNFLEL